MRVYLDAVPIIYVVEQDARFGPRAVAWLAANATQLVSSELARLETLVKPVRNRDARRIADMEQFFARQLTDFVTLDRPVLDRAVSIRAQFGFKTADAIHLAAAVESRCDVFYTNYHRLTRFTGIRVVVI